MKIPLPSKLSKPARRALNHSGILVLNDLAKFRESEIRNLHGMGQKGLELLMKTMAEHNITFKS